MKVGLVLGAGGIQGGAWLTGGLDALAEETGWDPTEADYVVGTSAGSMIGALCASGVPPWFMVAHSRGEVFDGVVDANGRPAADADRAAGARFGSSEPGPRSGRAPGGWRSARSPTRAATRRPPWPPAGSRAASSRPRRSATRSAASSPTAGARTPTYGSSPATTRRGGEWPSGVTAPPQAELADAVAASCAIPGIYHPVSDRRAPLRRRRHLLGLEPGPAPRRGARPGDLPEPDLDAPSHPGHQPARRFSTSPSNRLGPAPRKRGQEAPRRAAPRWS